MVESYSERQQRLAAERIFKAITPQIGRIAADVQAQQRSIGTAVQLFGEQYRKMLADVAANVPRFEIPALKLDYQSLFPDIAAIQAHALRNVLPAAHAV